LTRNVSFGLLVMAVLQLGELMGVACLIEWGWYGVYSTFLNGLEFYNS